METTVKKNKQEIREKNDRRKTNESEMNKRERERENGQIGETKFC